MNYDEMNYDEMKITEQGKTEAIKAISYFLTKVHPFLLSSEYSRYQCEVKLVCANTDYSISNGMKPYPFMKLWKLSTDFKYYEDNFINDGNYVSLDPKKKNLLLDNTLNPDFGGLYYLSSFLFKYLDKPYNIYYSLFNEKSLKRGQKATTINKDTAYSTQVLPIDIDFDSYEDYKKVENTFFELGIELLSVFTGHGYHILILLDELSEDKELFKRFTEMLDRKGLPVDISITDTPRVLRLPETWNAKKFNGKEKYEDEVLKKTRIVSDTNKRYSIQSVFNKVETLPDVQPVEIINEIKHIICSRCLDKQERIDLFSKHTPEKLAIRLYDMCDFKELNPTIQRILIDTTITNNRHKIIYTLVPYFKNVIGLSHEDVLLLFNVWSRVFLDKNMPYEELKRYVKYPYNSRYNGSMGKYLKTVTDIYGYIDIITTDEIEVVEGDLKVKIPVSVMKSLAYKDFWSMSRDEQLELSSSGELEDGLTAKCHTAFKIYILLMDERLKRRNKACEDEDTFTEKEILNICNISRATFRRAINHLAEDENPTTLSPNISLLIRIKGDKKNGASYYYKLQEAILFDTKFISLETSFIQQALFHSSKSLTDSEFKVMCLIKFFAQHQGQKEAIWLSQRIWGGFCSMERTLMNKKLQSLATKDYIHISLKKVVDSNGNELDKKVTLLKTLS